MNEDFYISLIYKKLSGEISPSQEDELTQWMALSEDNKITYEAVVTAWNNSDLLQEDIGDIDVAQEYASLDALLDDNVATQSETKVRTLSKKENRWNIRSIAASVVLLVAASFLIYNMLGNKDNEVELLTLSSDANPLNKVLPDGTLVYLNTNSSLQYPDKFGDSDRKVKLTGEAYFEVKHDQDHPFTVETNDEEVTVLGTKFNIDQKPDNSTSVYVSEGKVAVSLKSGSERVVLTKGEKAVSRPSKGTITKSLSSDNEIGWHTQKLFFLNTTMSEIVSQLSDFYGVNIKIDNPDFEKCPVDNYTIDGQSLETTLNDLGTILSFEVEENRVNEIIIKGGKCN